MRIFSLLFMIFLVGTLLGQDRPANGMTPSKPRYYLLKNAKIIISPEKMLPMGSILIEGSTIVEVGTFIIKPADAVEIDCKGKVIVPAFIELKSDIGLPQPKGKPYSPFPQYESAKNPNHSWNESIHPEYASAADYSPDAKSIDHLTSLGFGYALTHVPDGIMRGTGCLVNLSATGTPADMLIAQASSHNSFEKGSSQQTYPSSQMGAIALMRQTYYDLDWYKHQKNSAPNISLDALTNQQGLPLFFEAEEAQEILRMAKIASEFQLNPTYFGSGDEYTLLSSLQAISAPVIVPINFPTAFDVTDPFLNREIPLSALKHWELAPSNPYLLKSASINVGFTSHGIKNDKEFWTNVHKAIGRGLSTADALAALTTVPAKILHADHRIGTIEKNKVASFFIYDENPFEKQTTLLEQWIIGERKVVKTADITGVAGVYDIIIDGKTIEIEIKQKGNAYVVKRLDKTTSLPTSFQLSGNDVVIQLSDSTNQQVESILLHGKLHERLGVMEGEGTVGSGRWIKWSAIKRKKINEKETPEMRIAVDSNYRNKVWMPMMAYGSDTLPTTKTYVIKNVTAWTNESDGILKNATVIVQNGKITFVGDGGYRTPAGAIEIDGKGMHLTTGIIDEHSHIAISKGVNEGGQAIAAEVSIGDVVNHRDIDIYRQLAGGVTCSQLLHGSADPIGGQSALIKLKWGFTPDQMLIPNAPKFIKFALGENVKQTNWGDYQTSRFPQTRMGVEQLYMDAFNRALEYKKQQKDPNQKHHHHDLELETLLEILEGKRFVTCHSYVQSEINMLMHVADTFGFRLNTFTHILEGYKLADKMKTHGAGASTFADWWAYKYEVKDAIPYNATLMHNQGLVVAINSDDAEMGRRLNQEAAKAVKYGGMSEEDAWKLVTLNPAKLLHLDDRMGSLKSGKDADLVLWTTNPLSIEAIPTMVWIDGILFFDRKIDAQKQVTNQLEKARLISLMLNENASGNKVPYQPKETKHFHCNTIGVEGSSESNMH